jgi:hypothetical protein
MCYGFRATSFLHFFVLLSGAVSCPMVKTSNSSIRGRVTDATGAIIPGATVELTSLERETVTKSTLEATQAYIYLPPSRPANTA